MTMHEASRTLLKSPPELWAECSDAASLNRHLDRFGEIRITRLEPETAVAWEGENASGTVKLEPSGWGTRVILTAEAQEPEPEEPPESVVAAGPWGPPELAPAPVASEPVPPEPVPPEPVATEPESPVRAEVQSGLLARIRSSWRRSGAMTLEPSPSDPEPDDTTAVAEPPAEIEPEPVPPVAQESEPPPPIAEPPPTVAALTGALDSLGMAHHRPFSRG